MPYKLDTKTGLQSTVKQPSEDRLLNFDISGMLGLNTISSTSATFTNLGRVTGSTDVSLGAATFSGAVVQVRVTGGQDFEDYKVTIAVTDSGSNDLEAEIVVNVRDL